MHTMLERFFSEHSRKAGWTSRDAELHRDAAAQRSPRTRSTKRRAAGWSVRRCCGRPIARGDRRRPRGAGSTVELADPGGYPTGPRARARSFGYNAVIATPLEPHGRDSAACACAAGSTALDHATRVVPRHRLQERARSDRARRASSTAARRCSCRSTCSLARMLLGTRSARRGRRVPQHLPPRRIPTRADLRRLRLATAGRSSTGDPHPHRRGHGQRRLPRRASQRECRYCDFDAALRRRPRSASRERKQRRRAHGLVRRR